MVIVFGSLNVDMVFPVPTMPRPGETLLCEGYKLYPGGKGANQAVAAARAGAETFMFGCIGNDVFGQICRASLASSGAHTQHLFTHETPTGCATICVDAKGENMITVASGANLFARSSSVPDALLEASSTLVLQMETPPSDNWKLIERAAQKGSRILLNLAPASLLPETILQALSILVVNQGEASNLGTNLGFGEVSPPLIAQRISRHYGITCIVTLGAEGVLATTPQGTWELPALPITPLDTTAAGDAFVGVLAATLDKGLPLEKALRYAVAASGLACTSEGAQPSLPTYQQIEEAVPLVPAPTFSF